MSKTEKRELQDQAFKLDPDEEKRRELGYRSIESLSIDELRELILAIERKDKFVEMSKTEKIFMNNIRDGIIISYDHMYDAIPKIRDARISFNDTVESGLMGTEYILARESMARWKEIFNSQYEHLRKNLITATETVEVDGGRLLRFITIKVENLHNRLDLSPPLQADDREYMLGMLYQLDRIINM